MLTENCERMTRLMVGRACGNCGTDSSSLTVGADEANGHALRYGIGRRYRFPVQPIVGNCKQEGHNMNLVSH